jgi:WD40 repeat protein
VSNLRVWDAAAGKLVWELQRSFTAAAGPPKVRLSPDGTLVAVVTGARVRLWEVATGELRREWDASEKALRDAAFTPDGTGLACGGEDGVIRVWSLIGGRPPREVARGLDTVSGLVLSPDGSMLASLSGTLSLRDTKAGRVLRQDNFIRLWDVRTGDLLRRLTVCGEKAVPEWWGSDLHIAFTPDGKQVLATSDSDRTLRSWDAATGRELRQLRYGRAGINAFAVSPDGNQLAVALGAPGGSVLRLFDFRSGGREPLPVPGHSAGVSLVAVSPDGRLAATASEYIGGDDVLLWETATGRPLRVLRGHEGELFALAFADGRTFLSASADRTLRGWDTETGKQKTKVDLASGLAGWGFSPDRKLLAAAADLRSGGDSTVLLIDVAIGKTVQSLTHPSPIRRVVIAPDGRTAYTCSQDRFVRAWDTATGLELRRFPATESGGSDPLWGAGALGATLSADGTILAVVRQGHPVLLLSPATGKSLRRLDRDSNNSAVVAFSPDGRTLARAGDLQDPTIRLFDLSTGRERRRLTGHEGAVLALAFSADGRRLISGSADTTAIVWDVAAPDRQNVVAPR